MSFASASASGGIHVSQPVIVIIAVVAIIGVLAIFGYRSPDRAPGEETKAQRDRIEN